MLNDFNRVDNFDLKQLTTLKIGGQANISYSPISLGDMAEAIRKHHIHGENVTILGAGSNLLISSAGIDGAVVITKNLKDVIKISENQIFAQCGAKASSLARLAYDASLADSEFLIGIPGSIGGAIYMNAGAHGQNVKNIIEKVKIYNLSTYQVEDLPLKALEFKYRSSTFMEKGYVILSGIFNLPLGNKDKIKEKMDFHVNYRAKNHPPLTEYSAGSTFRNPEGEYAANLLEKVGAKEYIENGRVRFSQKHANFLYNFNDATSTDVIKLMHKMRQRVYDEFGIKLHPEIKFVGKRTDEEAELWEIMTKTKN